MPAQEFNWTSPDGIVFSACEWRPGVAPRAAVLLVHGLGEHMRRYEHVARAFNAAGVGMLAFDTRGHGKTGGPRGHFPSFDLVYDDIQHFLAETRSRYPGMPVFLYGHSLGGNLVLGFALKRKPELAGAIVTSPGLQPGTPLPAAKMTLARLMARLAPAFTLANGLDVDNLSTTPGLSAAYKADPLNHDRVSARLGMDLIERGQWIIEHAAEFPLPLLLMQGGADHLVSPRATGLFAQAAPADKITYRLVEAGYHELHNEPYSADIIQTMVDWMEKRITA